MHSTVMRSSCASLAAVVVALFISTGLIGPLMRFCFGTPPGFRQHFVSMTSLTQAALCHAFSVAFAYMIVGFLFRNSGRVSNWTAAYFASNPLVIGVGFLIFKLIYERLPLPHHDIEFYTLKVGIPFAILGSVPSAACFRLGGKLT